MNIDDDYCLYSQQCGIGTDCSECYQERIAALIAMVRQLEADKAGLVDVLMAFNRYFTSGNDVPVERATIHAKSEAVFAMRQALANYGSVKK